MFIKKLLLKIYKTISIHFQNIFRTRFNTDMYIAQCNIVTKIHKTTFSEYKNKYNGKDIAIIATGPSLNKYMPINWVHNKLKTKRAKLTCTICVSYNGTISNTENQDVLSTKREVDIFKLSDDQLNAIQEMFTSSEGGQSSFGDATNRGSVDLLTSSLATRIRKGRISTDGNITSIFKSANDNVIRESLKRFRK